VGIPVLGFEVKIIGEDDREVAAGQTGEIAGRGAGNMSGYYKRPLETQALIWRDADGRSFIRSGDIGRLDADGFLSIVDRKKDMIISGGFNIFPTDIEAVVGEHPDVLDVAVIGVPHEKWGETPLAWVIPHGGRSADAQAILDWANGRLARYQRIWQVRLCAELPRNALGKVLKRVLRDAYNAQN
jgi:acyl-CoA synthetase (AMP-forming)/AMP-acid ligase II